VKTISRTSQFKRDFKRMVKRGKNVDCLKEVVDLLCEEKELPAKYQDHRLSGLWHRHRECHIEPDWLLIYLCKPNEIILERTGSHSDLFK